ncbi:BTB/POZ domain-containing protein [Phthorimaea operculella]|nr:BTB/POZ domain-containing protein [Phthorimaea operculella]
MAQFSLSWESHKSNICSGLSSLQQNGEFVDMTLAADGHHVKVHRMVMSLVSPYLKELLNSAPCQHPVIFLNKISYTTLCAILEYVYTGEVMVGKDSLTELIDAGKELHIRGLEDMKIEIPSQAQYSASQSMAAQNNEGQPLAETGYFNKSRTPDIPQKSTRNRNNKSENMQEITDGFMTPLALAHSLPADAFGNENATVLQLANHKPNHPCPAPPPPVSLICQSVANRTPTFIVDAIHAGFDGPASRHLSPPTAAAIAITAACFSLAVSAVPAESAAAVQAGAHNAQLTEKRTHETSSISPIAEYLHGFGYEGHVAAVHAPAEQLGATLPRWRAPEPEYPVVRLRNAPPKERPVKGAIRDLPVDTDPEDIQKELTTTLGYEADYDTTCAHSKCANCGSSHLVNSLDCPVRSYEARRTEEDGSGTAGRSYYGGCEQPLRNYDDEEAEA